MEAETEAINRLQKQHTKEAMHCPSCDTALKSYEIAKHCEEELEKLKQIQAIPLATNGETGVPEETNDSDLPNGSRNAETRKPWAVFRRVQKNRQSRLRLRHRKRPVQQQPEHICPVCNLNFLHDEIQRHVEQCLRRSNATANGRHTGEDNSDENSEEGDFAEYEEYEWAGQKRIRVSSLLQGGYASIGIGTIVSNYNAEEDDEDLNVDEDDTHIYGPPQYAENDVIPPAIETNESSDDHNVATYMRHLIAGNSSQNPSVETASDLANVSVGEQLDTTTADVKFQSNTYNEVETKRQNYLQIIESLKAKLRHYENHIQNKFKCLICLDEYRNPAISVSCWHVHCEECWLRSLGARKLCPQCNLITTPKDLRRIYM